jgi:hypothetical protein
MGICTKTSSNTVSNITEGGRKERNASKNTCDQGEFVPNEGHKGPKAQRPKGPKVQRSKAQKHKNRITLPRNTPKNGAVT